MFLKQRVYRSRHENLLPQEKSSFTIRMIYWNVAVVKTQDNESYSDDSSHQ